MARRGKTRFVVFYGDDREEDTLIVAVGEYTHKRAALDALETEEAGEFGEPGDVAYLYQGALGEDLVLVKEVHGGRE